MPLDTGWIWDVASSRYRSTKTGRYINPTELDRLRDLFIEAQKAKADALVQQLVDKRISIQDWTLGMRQNIKDTYVAEYAASKGGMANVTQAEWGRIGQQLRVQYQYLDRFAAEIAAGNLTPGQIAMRAKMYIGSAAKVFERGKAENTGILELPAYPGDGQTQCLTNCKCHWHIKETKTAWRATWVLGVAEHCGDCVQNAANWNPLVVAK